MLVQKLPLFVAELTVKVVEMDFSVSSFLLSFGAADPKNAFVHAEHDGSARHRPHQVRRHSAVETGEAFF